MLFENLFSMFIRLAAATTCYGVMCISRTLCSMFKCSLILKIKIHILSFYYVGFKKIALKHRYLRFLVKELNKHGQVLILVQGCPTFLPILPERPKLWGVEYSPIKNVYI